jgi:hypothetical protein
MKFADAVRSFDSTRQPKQRSIQHARNISWAWVSLFKSPLRFDLAADSTTTRQPCASSDAYKSNLTKLLLITSNALTSTARRKITWSRQLWNP